MRKIIFNLAMSIDGYIADNEGGFAWIKGDGDNHKNTKNTYDFVAFLNSVDTIIMGAKAYEDCPKETLESFSNKKIIVATSRKLHGAENVEFINGEITSIINDLKQKEGKDIWLFGGGAVIDPFIKQNIIDEYILGIIPTILGSGRRLFFDDNPMINLHLDDYYITEGITIIKYSKR